MSHLAQAVCLLLLFGISTVYSDECLIKDHGPYHSGKGSEFSANCIEFICESGGIWHTAKDYNPRCATCTVQNDPHFTTFSGAKYDWHEDQTYVLAEEVDNGTVVSYVHQKFKNCDWGGHSVSCVDTVYFKPRMMDEKNRIHIEMNHVVKIDGHSNTITLPDRYMQVLEGPTGQHPALAFNYNGCLHIIAADQQDFLVKVCNGWVRIFSPKEELSNRKVNGMCGSPNRGSADDDLKLRDGSKVHNPGYHGFDNLVSSTFAADWQVGGGRKAISSKKVEMEPCKASGAQKAEYIRICEELLSNYASLSEEIKIDFIAMCAFDRCIIIQSKADNNTVQEWLDVWGKNSEQEVFEQAHQDDKTDKEYDYILALVDYYDDMDTTESDIVSTTSDPEEVATTLKPTTTTTKKTTPPPTTTKTTITPPTTTKTTTTPPTTTKTITSKTILAEEVATTLKPTTTGSHGDRIVVQVLQNVN